MSLLQGHLWVESRRCAILHHGTGLSSHLKILIMDHLTNYNLVSFKYCENTCDQEGFFGLIPLEWSKFDTLFEI